MLTKANRITTMHDVMHALRHNTSVSYTHLWLSALSAFPVYAFLGALTLACRFYAKPFLDAHGLPDSVNVAGGFVACAVALVIFEVRKVELANFLPALVVAPVLVWLLG